MKAILLTGTSSGLGRALFDRLQGEQVYLCCISRRFLSYQKRAAASNRNIRLVECDLSRPEETARLPLSTLLRRAKIEEVVFINNAGTIEPLGAVGKLNDARLIRSVQVNLTSPMILTNALLKLRRGTKPKISILNISTGAAHRPIVGWAAYCSTKAGSRMFFDVLREQHPGGAGVSVHSIDPGVIDTKMQQRIRGLSRSAFPLRAYFHQLKKGGKLLAPSAVAEKIVREHVRI